MAHRLLPLALTLSVAATGCAAAHLALRPASTVQQTSAQVVDLRGGNSQAPSGWGTVDVKVDNLPAQFATQGLNGGVKLTLRIVDDEGNELTDFDGNKTFYRAAVTGNTVTFKLPALPANSTNPSYIGNPSWIGGNAYVFQVRAYTSGQTLTDAAATPRTGYPSLLDATDPATPSNRPVITTSTILASGEIRGVVVAGLPTTIAVSTFAHAAANLDTTAGTPVSVVQLSGAAVDGTGNLRVRLTAVDAAKLGGTFGTATGSITFAAGTPTVGDRIRVEFTDSKPTPTTYRVFYKVAPGVTTESQLATAVGGALDSALSAYSISDDAAGSLTITSDAGGARFNAASGAGALTVTADSTMSALSVTDIAGGTSTTRATGEFTLGGIPYDGDTVNISFKNDEATPADVDFDFTPSSSPHSVPNEAWYIALYLNQDASFSASYTAVSVPDRNTNYWDATASVRITANAVGASYNASASFPLTVTPAHVDVVGINPSVTPIAGGTGTRTVRAALFFPTARTATTTWTVDRESATALDASLSNIANARTGTIPTLTGALANTMHFVDLDAWSLVSGVWNFKITGATGYSTFQVFDLDTGRNVTTSVPAI